MPHTSSTARPGRRAVAFGASLAALAAIGAGALTAGAAVVPDRTVRFSGPAGVALDGDSANPAISSSARVAAFDTSATNVGPPDENGPTRDVYAVDVVTGVAQLVSRQVDGPAADGPSTDPALSGPSRRIVFTSAATNLVPDDTNGRTDIFLRDGDGPIHRVSLAFDGQQANGESLGADISDDGRFVVFSSDATNLVPNDTNGVEDVFVRDLVAGTTIRVSLGRANRQANGRSGTASISPDGGFVSFESDATNLVGADGNDVSDVYLRDLSAGRTARVSVSNAGEEQDRAVIPPFRQVSDVSRGGRFVAFESDGTNLVRRDVNSDTDVFLRDRRQDVTTRVSVNSSAVQGDNDSFAPAITPDSRYIVFQSFAANLAPGDAEGADIFVHDRIRGGTVVASVSSAGESRGPETVRQLLQQPAISNTARIVAFISTAANLAPGDTNNVSDVFLRVQAPPAGQVISAPRYVGARGGRFTVAADDPQAGRVLCSVDGGPKRDCGFPEARIPIRGLAEGRHVVRAHVGGPGMLFDERTLRFRFTLDTSRPAAVIDVPRGARVLRSLRQVRGRAGDQLSGVARVEVAILTLDSRGRCRFYDGRRFKRASCRTRRFLRATGGRRWRLRLRARPHGLVGVIARPVDRAGNHGPRVRALTVVR